MPDLLIELFSEEIPARMQGKARDDLRRLVTDGLVTAGLTYASAGAFSTPRRLVLAVDGLTAQSRAVREERKGPRVDAPAAAIEGFVRSTGLALAQLEVRDDKKAQVYFAVVERPGRDAAAIVAEVLEAAVRGFPWPRSMRWGSGSLRWVRPLQSILCLLSDEAGAAVVPLSVDGIVAGDVTQGHRFLSRGHFAVSGFDDYATRLKRAFVVLDSAEREAAIWQGAVNLAFAAGLEVVPDAGLLAEVAGLVEWPVPLLGRIGPAFLDLPPEVLQTSMREHQKFFSVKNPRTSRIEGFVTVANTETADHGATILAGNQKVLSARLSDAKFFYDKDLAVARAGMGAWLDGLNSVTFHNKLGSQADRVARIADLAREIAPLVGADPDQAEQAARIAKADLRSAMVGEFPELQGVMGMYYARAAGLPEGVALAARDHYSPLGPTDAVPTEPVSVAVALADKLDTLTGFWAIDEKPTGSKDPFALRRAALGVIRLVLGSSSKFHLIEPISRQVRILRESRRSRLDTIANVEYDLARSEKERAASSLAILLDAKMETDVPETADLLSAKKRFAMDFYKAHEVKFEIFEAQWLPVEKEEKRFVLNASSDLLTFLHDRLKTYLKDQSIPHDVLDACRAMPGNDDLTLLVNRARALTAFLETEDGPNLLQGFKRASTILSQAETRDGVEYSYGADVKFAQTDEELALFAALDTAEAAIAPAMASEDFATAMTAMADLRAPIDAFFTAVQINDPSEVIRRNRLNLLHRIRTICSGVADLTRIES